VKAIPRRTLLPGLGLALTVAAAAAVSLAGGRGPEAHLRAAVRGYVGALAAGDAAAAAAWREDGLPEPEQRRATALRGAAWALGGDEIDEGGAQALVEVVWMPPGGREYLEVQLWHMGPGGAWRFVALER